MFPSLLVGWLKKTAAAIAAAVFAGLDFFLLVQNISIHAIWRIFRRY